MLTCASLVVSVLGSAPGARDDDATPPAGLVAAYRSVRSSDDVVRVDSDVQFDWGSHSPDLRVPAGPFQATWRGTLTVPTTATYTFHLHAVGAARVVVAGRTQIEGTAPTAQWLNGSPVRLERGSVPIEVQFRKTAETARIGLYWESTAFALEPITARWLSHHRTPAAAGAFERGHELARAYRCAACHAVPGLDAPTKGPALDRLAGQVQPDWLVRWLDAPPAQRPDTRMPAFSLSAEEVRAVASYLLLAGAAAPRESSAGRGGDAARGESRFRTLGCLACHQLGKLGTPTVFGGGSLDGIAQKRSPEMLRRWLKQPERLNADHRMPVFQLSDREMDDLATYLATLSGDARAERFVPRAEWKDRGRQLIRELRCAACHTIAGEPAPSATAWRGGPADAATWQRGCMGETGRGSRPSYRLSEADGAAIRAFFAALPAAPATQSRYEHGRNLLRERNCVACHARDVEPGLLPAGRRADDDSETAAQAARGELEPPSLSAVGDKFQDETLRKLIAGGLPPRRPWLQVRMPRFAHRDADVAAIVEFLVQHDRIPARPGEAAAGSPPAPLDEGVALAAGQQLVSARGFGCMSCHTLGRHQPRGIAVNARGSDLLGIDTRVRGEWFRRWTRDPARIVPGMEMPSIVLPVAGVLDGRLDRQLDALWTALSSPAFVVPNDRDSAEQVIGLRPGDRPVVLRDVMFDCPPGSGWCPRAFALGLPNRHNLLLDLDTFALRGWWFGDFARERTEGKTWLWEPGGLPVWSAAGSLPSVALRHRRRGDLMLPEARRGGSLGRLMEWTREAGDIALVYQLHFPQQPDLQITETYGAWGAERPMGFARTIRAAGVDGTRGTDWEPVVLQVADEFAAGGRELRRRGPLGVSVITAVSSHWRDTAPQPNLQGTCYQLPMAPNAQTQSYTAELTYGIAQDAPLASGASAVPTTHRDAGELKPVNLDVVPGFEAIRLPLDPSVMPTAIAFRGDGTPVVCSLKGQVFLARDRSGDGLEDTWQAISDHLAAPFGVLADGPAVLVSHKPELLRLEDKDGDGMADSVRVLASGWGYTHDYHDWTFGLLRDAAGNLYVTTGSDYAWAARPESSRRWRGAALRITPDGRIEELARGLRYPTGLAMNRVGDIFMSDNQGVQNTFNEINHLVAGSRYGVPARDDPARDDWPERLAAIQIPHPLTRSVNGLCFLDGVQFGPFQGHGIGCEYDTRGLIRFTLQRVGDTYQGACYPFTALVEPDPPEPGESVPKLPPAQPGQLLGPIACAVSPCGDLYIGGIRDSGWGGSNNIGELVRLRLRGPLPLGIREVQATSDGFLIEFTGPVEPARAADPQRYQITSARRIYRGTYATPDSDRRIERIAAVRVRPDGKSVALRLDALRAGFVYDLHVGSVGPSDRPLWPSDAYYTLNQIAP
jgi:mono/diheme cytochrome c family protein